MLEPTLTTALPEMMPWMMTIFLSLPVTAATRSSSVETVVVVPPTPPVVLQFNCCECKGTKSAYLVTYPAA